MKENRTIAETKNFIVLDAYTFNIFNYEGLTKEIQMKHKHYGYYSGQLISFQKVLLVA